MDTPAADAKAASTIPDGKMDVPTSSIADGFDTGRLLTDNVPTVDVVPDTKVGGEKPTGTDETIVTNAEKPDGDTKGDEGKEPGEAEAKGKPGRYDLDPDWQRIMRERDEARIEAAAAKAKLEVLQPPVTTAKTGGTDTSSAPDIPYKDITKMSKEELIEWNEEDPHGYAANLYAQVRHEITQELKAKQDRERATSSVKTTYEQYEKDHPDFKGLWDSGEITRYMETHPGHNPLSAHMAMTSGKIHEDAKAYMEAVVAKAVKETEQRVIKNFQAKQNAEVITGGSGIKTDEGLPDELKNSSKYGGPVSALAARLTRLRQRDA